MARRGRLPGGGRGRHERRAGYDAFLHLIFLGFVFGMIVGHAPIILPAVLRVPLAFRPRFWLHAALLEGSVALRVGADAAGWVDGRRIGALVNGIAVLVFLASTVLAIVQAQRERRKRSSRSSGKPPGLPGSTGT